MRTVFRRRLVVGILIAMLAILLPSGCDDFALVDLFYEHSGVELAISPGAAALQPSGTLQFTGSGGAPGYTFRVADAGGGTIESDTGLYTAPAEPGEFKVEVTDRAGEASAATVYVAGSTLLRIEPATAAVQQGGTQEFTASGGKTPYVFAVAPGTPGTIDQNGSVVVFEASEGVGHGEVIVTDANFSRASARIYVYDETTLALIPDRNPIHQGERTGLTPYGGTPAYQLDLVSDTTGLVYDDGLGELVGPTDAVEYRASDSIGVVTIRLTDSATATADLDITILPAPPFNLNASWTPQGKPEVTLSWSYDKPGIDEFRIERLSEDDTVYGFIANVPSGSRVYKDTNGVSPGKSHVYRVFATAGTHESAPASVFIPRR